VVSIYDCTINRSTCGKYGDKRRIQFNIETLGEKKKDNGKDCSCSRAALPRNSLYTENKNNRVEIDNYKNWITSLSYKAKSQHTFHKFLIFRIFIEKRYLFLLI